TLSGQVDDLGRITLHQFLVQAPFDLLAELGRDGVEFEVHPRHPFLHVSPGDLGPEVAPHDSRKGMEGGVGAHDVVAPLPVDDSFDRCAGIRQLRRLDYMDQPAVTTDGVDDPNLSAVPTDHAGVTRLTSSPSVEDGPVENDEAVSHLEHRPFGTVSLAVVAGQFLDLHHQSFRWTTRATLCGPIDNRAEGPSRRHRKPHRAGRAKLSPVDAAMHRYPLE